MNTEILNPLDKQCKFITLLGFTVEPRKQCAVLSQCHVSISWSMFLPCSYVLFDYMVVACNSAYHHQYLEKAILNPLNFAKTDTIEIHLPLKDIITGILCLQKFQEQGGIYHYVSLCKDCKMIFALQALSSVKLPIPICLSTLNSYFLILFIYIMLRKCQKSKRQPSGDWGKN